MNTNVPNETICLRHYTSDQEYKEISALQDLCYEYDKTNLKLELDYRKEMPRDSRVGLHTVNEFLYYIDETLVAYLGISCFGGNIGEVNGMTHPAWRRKGIFKRLYELAIIECRNRNFNKILLLSDGKSNAGIEFIKSVGGKYAFSEYRMAVTNPVSDPDFNQVTLRKAEKSDLKEIMRQNAIYFDDILEEDNIQQEDQPNEITYVAEHKGDVVGKIKVELDNDSAYLFAFGILPEFRGKGYGKATLGNVLKLLNEKNIHNIALDVECENSTALNLYKSFGFEEKSIMNYYSV